MSGVTGIELFEGNENHVAYVNIRPADLKTPNGRFIIINLQHAWIGTANPLFIVFYNLDGVESKMGVRYDVDKGFLVGDIEDLNIDEALQQEILELRTPVMQLIGEAGNELAQLRMLTSCLPAQRLELK